MTTEYWVSFLSASLLINVTPGPDLLFLLSKSNSSGRRTAFLGAVGLWTAALTHVSAVAIGLSAIIFASQTLFTLIKYIGSVYLIWLGIKLFFSSQNTSEVTLVKGGDFHSFFSGFFVNISNPKAALFFLAFLPAFVQSGNEHPQVHVFILGVLVVVIKMLVELMLILFSGYIAKGFIKHKKLGKVVKKTSAIFFIGFGFQLLTLRRS